MVKVIGAGFPRTGTSSMKAALEKLGFGPTYHMFEIFKNPHHVDRWLPLAAGEPVNWDEVFDGYQSAMDWPASHFWREQADAYPEAKVVLTVREPERWLTSFKGLMDMGPRRASPEDLPEAMRDFFAPMARLQPVFELMTRNTFGSDWTPENQDDKVALEAFTTHIDRVKASLPADRLLVFDVREGWGPLCAFLGVEAPDEPFPHLNDAASMRRMLDAFAREGRMDSPFE